MSPEEFLPEVPSPTHERPLRTADFPRVLVDPDARKATVDRGTIRVRVSPFVYSAWGFGVLMPKRGEAESKEHALA